MKLANNELLPDGFLKQFGEKIDSHQKMLVVLENVQIKLERFHKLSKEEIIELERREKRLTEDLKKLERDIKTNCLTLTKKLQNHYIVFKEGMKNLQRSINTSKQEFEDDKSNLFNNYSNSTSELIYNKMIKQLQTIIMLENNKFENNNINKDLKEAVKISTKLCAEFTKKRSRR